MHYDITLGWLWWGLILSYLILVQIMWSLPSLVRNRFATIMKTMFAVMLNIVPVIIRNTLILNAGINIGTKKIYPAIWQCFRKHWFWRNAGPFYLEGCNIYLTLMYTIITFVHLNCHITDRQTQRQMKWQNKSFVCHEVVMPTQWTSTGVPMCHPST